LVAFTNQQRQKGISIRKIMGAGINEIVPLVTRNFIALVGISCLFAFPVAYIFMDKWLRIFPYNTGLSRYTIFTFSNCSTRNNNAYGKFSCCKSCGGKPCKKFKSGIANQNLS
jgi:hypothetical protein